MSVHFLKEIKDRSYVDTKEAVSACGSLRHRVEDVQDFRQNDESFTRDTDEVTCGRCQETHVFTREAQNEWGFKDGVDVVHVRSLDWEGVYVDGEMFYENHAGRMDWDALLESLEGKTIGTFRKFRVQSWMEQRGRASFPHALDDIPNEVIPS